MSNTAADAGVPTEQEAIDFWCDWLDQLEARGLSEPRPEFAFMGGYTRGYSAGRAAAEAERDALRDALAEARAVCNYVALGRDATLADEPLRTFARRVRGKLDALDREARARALPASGETE